MSTSLSVRPQPLSLSLAKVANRSFGCAPIGCFIPSSIVLGYWAAWYVVESKVSPPLPGKAPAPFDWDTWLPLGLASAAGLCLALLVAHFFVADCLARRRDAENRRLAALHALQLCKESAVQANQHLEAANQWLLKSDYEFQSSAFAPFWDAIENAARFLDLCHASYAAIQSNRLKYYQVLAPSEHNFPVLESQLAALDDPSQALAEFRRLVRQGQTNLGFAQIWEHRATRQSIVAGFQTLADGIRHLEATLVKSLDQLRRSVSSDLARVIFFQGRILSVVESAMRPAD